MQFVRVVQDQYIQVMTDNGFLLTVRHYLGVTRLTINETHGVTRAIRLSLAFGGSRLPSFLGCYTIGQSTELKLLILRHDTSAQYAL